MDSAATLMREARTAAGLSSLALARRAQVPASTVTRIESGKVDPTFGMLNKLLRAAGRELKVSAGSNPRPALADLVGAWVEEPEGHPDLRLIRSFIDRLRLRPNELEGSIACPPTRSPSPVLDALLSGVAEKLADDAGRPRPPWTQRAVALQKEWSMPGTPRMMAKWRLEAPPQLLKRGLVIDEASLWRDPETVGA